MRQTTLQVIDQCNVRFTDLDPTTRRKMVEALKFVIPNARYIPSVRLGRWDGTVSFCTMGGASFLNLIDRLLSIITKKYIVRIDDRRPDHQFKFPMVTDQLFAAKVWPEGHRMAGEPIILRDYQVAAINTFIDNLQSVQQIATAAGKTALTAALSSLVEPYGRSVVIVPSKNLVTQTEADYRNLGLDVGVLFGERKEWNRKHTICTWQSLAVLDKKEIAVEFIKDVVCVISDECHTVRGKLLKDLLTGPFAKVPIRWGLTGTVPKEEHEAICLLAAIGPVVGGIRAVDLQERGVLANCQVEVIQLQDEHVAFNNYDSEHDFLVTDTTRLNRIARLTKAWTETGNTLLLVDRIEAGERLQELLPESVFICGETKLAERQQEYKAVQTEQHKIIIATYGVASVGIDLPRIFNLVLLEAGRSFVRTIQSIGRSLRRANDKEHANIYDVCSSLKYSKRHLAKRKTFYNEAEYPHNTTKVEYL